MRFLFAALLTLPLTAIAQESRGTVTGQVTDATGAAVPGVTIHLINNATSAVISAQASSDGNYTIPFVVPGTYRLTVEAAGFRKYERIDIPVRVNDVVSIDVEMQVGDVTQSVEVRAEVPLLESNNASVGQVIDQRRIMELPIQSGNAFELMLLTPGTVNSTNTRLRKAAATNATSQVITAGNPQYSNEFTIDGIPNTFANGTQPRIAFIPPQTAIGEFRVQTTGYESYLGRSMGSVVNVNTVGGASSLHGELHEWVGNSVLDAPNFIQNRSGLKKQVYQDNRFGGSLSGPVRIPRLYDGGTKTFFLYATERNIWRVPRSLTMTVPTEAQKTGDLSNLLALGSGYQVYDPLSTSVDSAGRYVRQALPGNIIPPNRIDPVSRNIAKYWPTANQAGTREARNNYSAGVSDLDEYYVHLGRVDHAFSDKHRAFVRVHYDWWEEEKQQFYGNESTGVLLNRINRGLAVDDVYVVSPSTVFNLRYGLTSQDFPERRRSEGFDLASLGFAPSLVNSIDPSRATFPFIGFGAVPPSSTLTGTGATSANMGGVYAGFGQWEQGDGTTNGVIHTFIGSLSTVKGSHSYRYGVDFRVYRSFNGRFGYDYSPALTFTSQYTNGPEETSPAAATGQELAAFLFGIPTGEMRNSASYATQELYYGFYFHDDWKISRNVTLNLGLRYEYESPLTERYNRAVAGFDATVASPIEAQARAAYARGATRPEELPADRFRVLGGLQFVERDTKGRALWSTERNNIMPRLGIAWQATPKTVVRTGGGLFYDTIGTNRSQPFQNGFTSVSPIIPTQDNGVTYRATIGNPLPEGLLPMPVDPPGLVTDLGRPLQFYPSDRIIPYAARWSFNIQRELPAGFLVDLGYAGNRGTRLQINREINATPGQYLSTSTERDAQRISELGRQYPNPFFGLDRAFTRTITRANLLRPFPQFGSIQITEPQGYSWWHAMTVRTERRFANGFSLQMGYTWSKLMEAIQYLNNFDAMPHEVVGTFDRPHRLTLNWIWEMPFGKGRRLGANTPRWADVFIGGWQVSGLWQQQSGQALPLGNFILRVDPKALVLADDQRTVDRWFNIEGFETNNSRQLASNVRTLPLSFNGLRGPGQWKVDMSAIKNFRLTEKLRFQFRAEAYNAFNHPNFVNPATNNAGQTGFGAITNVDPARQFQLAGRLTF